MSEMLYLPREGRTENFRADYTLLPEKDTLVATDGWINAPHRGSEIMEIITTELQALASSRGKKVIHRFEASTPKGRKLIDKYPEYKYAGRSSDHNPLYEKEFTP